MATLRNKRKLAALTRETQEEHPRNGQSRNTSVPRINEENITQVSEEIESRVTKKLSQEFSRAESRILGALSKLDEFLLNPQITMHSETVSGKFRKTNVENQGTNEDDSQSDPHPEAGIFCDQTTQNSDLEECCDTNTEKLRGKCFKLFLSPLSNHFFVQSSISRYLIDEFFWFLQKRSEKSITYYILIAARQLFDRFLRENLKNRAEIGYFDDTCHVKNRLMKYLGLQIA